MTMVVRSRVEDGVGVLTFAELDRENVLSPTLVEQAEAAHQSFIDAGVKVAVLEAEGPAFCSGRDPLVVRVPGVPPAGARLIDAIENSPLLWIAAVDGDVKGPGIHLVTVCAHVVAGPNARFRVPELLNGVYPRPVAAELTRIVGARRAMTLLLTGGAIDADEAVRSGLAGERAEAGAATALALTRAQGMLALGDDLLALTREGWRSRFESVPVPA